MLFERLPFLATTNQKLAFTSCVDLDFLIISEIRFILPVRDENMADNKLKVSIFDDEDISGIFNDLIFLLTDINKSQRRLEERLEANTEKLRKLENAISYLAYIPGNWLKLRYDSLTKYLWLTDKLFIPFDKNEAELLSIMFSKSSGKPRKKKFYCSEVAEKLNKNGGGNYTSKSVQQTANRIKRKLQDKYRLGSIIIVSTKEFYFPFK
jgi:hypothetical protein